MIVNDEEGKAIAGATIEPYSFRVKGVDSASAHNWLTFGPRLKQKTDSDGKVRLKYPVVAYPEEKQLTGKLNLIAAHPDYATEKAEISVDDAESSVRLIRGCSVEVSAYYGSERQPVHDIVANLSGDPSPQWKEVRKGVLKCGQLRAGEFMLQLMGKLPTGEIVHSEGRPFSLKKGETQKIALELRPGIRLEGRIRLAQTLNK